VGEGKLQDVPQRTTTAVRPWVDIESGFMRLLVHE
jgi:hypothetical protein